MNNTGDFLWFFPFILLQRQTLAFIHNSVDQRATSSEQNLITSRQNPAWTIKRASPFSDDEDDHNYGASGDSNYHEDYYVYDYYNDYYEDHNYNNSESEDRDQHGLMFASTDRSSKYRCLEKLGHHLHAIMLYNWIQKVWKYKEVLGEDWIYAWFFIFE